MVQDFPLCATFREIDQQNSLVRGEMDNMREKLLLLDNLALEQVHIDCLPLAAQSVTSFLLLRLTGNKKRR